MTQGLERIATAAVGIPIVLGLLWLGGWYFFGFVVVIALVAQYEMIRLLQHAKWPVDTMWTLVLGVVILIRPLVSHWEAIGTATLLLFAFSRLKTGPDRISERISGTLLASFYPVWLLSFLIDIQWKAFENLGQSGAFWLILMLFGLIWATDSGAYYSGKTFGRKKFAPSISPNKTWEGTIGGLVVAMVVATIFKYTVLTDLSWMDAGVLVLLGGVWGQLGDLLESAFKRNVGVKDSGNILPGHGGMLDRFDSLIFTAPAYYLYLCYATDLLSL